MFVLNMLPTNFTEVADRFGPYPTREAAMQDLARMGYVTDSLKAQIWTDFEYRILSSYEYRAFSLSHVRPVSEFM